MFLTLATLTTTGRAAIASAIMRQTIHVAWGLGDPAWDGEAAVLPSLVDATALAREVGRRLPTSVDFVKPDENGDIIISKGLGSDGLVQKARYSHSDVPTPYLHFFVQYDFHEAAESIIREVGIFMDSTFIDGLPPGQRYFMPEEISNAGQLLAVQILKPPIHRSAATRQVFDYVFPL